MERKQKITTAQVEDFLRDHKNPITKKRIAEALNCSTRTVSNKLKKIRRAKIPALATRLGIVIAEQVKDMPQAKIILQSGDWILRMFVGMAILADVAQKPLLEAAKMAMKQLPAEEKKLVRELMYKLANIASAAEVAGFLEEDNPK